MRRRLANCKTPDGYNTRASGPRSAMRPNEAGFDNHRVRQASSKNFDHRRSLEGSMICLNNDTESKRSNLGHEQEVVLTTQLSQTSNNIVPVKQVVQNMQARRPNRQLAITKKDSEALRKDQALISLSPMRPSSLSMVPSVPAEPADSLIEEYQKTDNKYNRTQRPKTGHIVENLGDLPKSI